MTDDQHHLAAAYALNALSVDERRAFEAHYGECEICSSEVEEFQATAEHLAVGAATNPPPDLKERVLAEIAETRQIPPVVPEAVVDLAERRRRRVILPVLLAAAAALVAGVATLASLRGPAGPSIDDLIAAPDAVVTQLDGDGGMVRVVWSPSEDRVAVIGRGLDDPGPGRAYALWFLLDEGVAPAGLFTPDGGEVRQILAVEDLASQGWGVTIEPETGSPQPTGEILYAGTL